MTEESSNGWSRRKTLAAGGALGATALVGNVFAQENGQDDNGGDDGDDQQESRNYRVTVTNLTRGQPFTPPAVAAHRPDVEVFAVGEPANEPTRQLAENGNPGPLLDLVANTDSIRDAAVGDVPLVPEADPGNTGNPYYTTLHLSADASATHLTFVSMLIATNDGIVGLDTVELPEDVNESNTYYANGYDVGTEQNTEMFADLVPPAKTLILGGEPEGTGESNEDIAENRVIRPHPGIEGVGNLPPSVYDWTEPAAVVQVERLAELQQEFQTTLSGANQVPPIETEASGQATFSLGEDGEELSYEVTVSNIENAVAAHIHCGRPDSNGPIGVTLYDGEPVSDGQDEGDQENGDGQENGEDQENGAGQENGDGQGNGEEQQQNGDEPEGTVLVEGTVTGPDEENDCGFETLDDVLAAMRSGRTYVNVHTEANPAGEIRGQIY